MGRIGYRFDIFLRCGCGRTAHFVAEEFPFSPSDLRFRCTACGSSEPEIAIWPIWQRAFRREGWSPWRRG